MKVSRFEERGLTIRAAATWLGGSFVVFGFATLIGGGSSGSGGEGRFWAEWCCHCVSDGRVTAEEFETGSVEAG